MKFLKALFARLLHSPLSREEAYLAGSANLVELENRMHHLERNTAFSPFNPNF